MQLSYFRIVVFLKSFFLREQMILPLNNIYHTKERRGLIPRGDYMFKKIMVTMCITISIILMLFTIAHASIRVDYNDIYTFKANFAEKIIRDFNSSGLTDRVIYEYIIFSINDALDTFSTFPLYIYSDYYGKLSYITIQTYDELFQHPTVKMIEKQSKARFFRAIYFSMTDFDLSQTEEPEWVLITIYNENNEVLYMLEINLGFVEEEKLENELINILGEISYAEEQHFNSVAYVSTFKLTIATYVKKFDEIVVDVLFTDEDGVVYGEAIMTKNHIFVENM